MEGGKAFTDPRPIAELMVYRNPSRLACRIVAMGQHQECYLTLLGLRWDILCRHVFVVGPQGSGKTASIYGPIMHSSLVPWESIQEIARTLRESRLEPFMGMLSPIYQPSQLEGVANAHQPAA